MTVALPLHEMSLPEKLELFETLWDDLSRQPQQLQSPEWHKDVLEDRRQNVQSGDETFSDWEDAKKEIRKRIS